VTGAAIAAAGIGIAGAVMVARGHLSPARGVGLGAGVLAGFGVLALLLYAIPKRGVRRWMRPRGAGAEPKKPASVARPQLQIHLALGLVSAGLSLAHAPMRGGGGSGAALLCALALTSAAGALAAIAYRLLPPRIARIERAAALPEDFSRACRDLHDRLYRTASGKSDLVKKLIEKILLPYARSPLGPIAILASGKSLREEQAALRAHIDAVLEGRGQERLAGLSELVRIVVELRALPAQRLLLAALRVWLPLHIATFGVAIALLLVHVAMAIGRRG